ncbi:MAG: ARMT1-like domain-containing protein [Actinobacteria bacterium]|nr:ARMT1-like domain-containing protein [Cyanobacteriota bacterium]MCL5770891.1 ARMT1-like domain-containing protein [Actinomycetota bacterium]
MKIQLDCIPCQIRQSLAIAKKLTTDDFIIQKSLKEVLKIATNFEEYQDHFSLLYDMLERVKKINPKDDPYKNFKEQFNKICLNIVPDLKKIAYKPNSIDEIFEVGLRISLSGNALDVMQGGILSEEFLEDAVKKSLTQKINLKNVDLLKQNISGANKILFIGDNAGEIVFDKIFIEILKDTILKDNKNDKDKITYVVRGGPSLNDSTIEDAVMVGMDKVVKVITTGVDLPGAYLPKCSKEFRKAYESSDLIISKGQGNFESLLEENKNIFFLLKIKCETILNFFNGRHKIGEVVVEHSKI